MRRGTVAIALLGLLAGGCGGGPRSAGPGPRSAARGARRDDGPDRQRGRASWYGERHHGRRTASGERFDMDALTGAHRTLPFGTRVKVTNLANGRSVVIRINDRGPWGRGRILDVSRAAARRLGMIAQGVADVTVEVILRP